MGLIFLLSLKQVVEKSWQSQDSKQGVLGEKRERYHCSPPPSSPPPKKKEEEENLSI